MVGSKMAKRAKKEEKVIVDVEPKVVVEEVKTEEATAIVEPIVAENPKTTKEEKKEARKAAHEAKKEARREALEAKSAYETAKKAKRDERVATIIKEDELEKLRKKYLLSKDNDYDAAIKAGKYSITVDERGITYVTPSLEEAATSYFCDAVFNAFKDNKPFFDEKDELGELVKAFYTAEYGTIHGEVAIIDLATYFNVRWRQCLGREFGTERFGASAIRKSYETNTEAKGFVKTNMLKNMAWGVTHSYLTNVLMTERMIYEIIPANNELFEAWNEYIADQEDVNEEVKELFTINQDGVCQFKVLYDIKKNTEDNLKKAEEITGFNPAVEANNESAESNQVKFEAAKAQEKELNASFKEAIEVSNEKEIKVATPVIPVQKPVEVPKTEPKTVSLGEAVTKSVQKTEHTFGETMSKSVENNSVNPAKIASNLAGSNVGPTVINPATGMPEQAQFDMYSQNNFAYEAVTPKLNSFTKLVHDMGFSVMYKDIPVYPGIIEAVILQKNTQIPVTSVMIDRYLIYGDNLRIITNLNADKDLRKECFIPISQQEAIKKVINGTFTRDDHRKIMEALPRALSDFSGKYSFLDKIDMRILGSVGGMQLKEYKKLVENISTILKDRSVPEARYRLADVVSADNFKLICDNYVWSCFKTGIMSEETCLKAAKDCTVIHYNPSLVNNKRGFKIKSMTSGEEK